ncbi:conserved hypothetical protein [Ricinus communis]|uniref:Uncharacterized protein n=1 Tax=Ricinus communis TaxID=3988 RepID=B9TF68_RICCO|nr:conserved hypothetical protein [Ricinus communis]
MHSRRCAAEGELPGGRSARRRRRRGARGPQVHEPSVRLELEFSQRVERAHRGTGPELAQGVVQGGFGRSPGSVEILVESGHRGLLCSFALAGCERTSLAS